MTRPHRAVKRFLDAAAQGRWDEVGDEGEALAAAVAAEPAEARWAPAVVILTGWARAEQGYLPVGIDLLERGLHHLVDPEVAREVGGTDAFYLRLCELYLLCGRPADAFPLLDAFRSPDAPLEVRFPCYRFLTLAAAAAGDDSRAQSFVNTAAELAPETHRSAHTHLVEGDRALWMASAGRLGAAIQHAELALPPLTGARSRSRPYKAWLASHAGAVALAVAALAADEGDPVAASRWIERALPALEVTRAATRMRLDGHLALARSAAARARGDFDDAEEQGQLARLTFQRMGLEPAAAHARLALARVLVAREVWVSARPALISASDALRRCGQHRAAGQADRLLGTIPVPAH